MSPALAGGFLTAGTLDLGIIFPILFFFKGGKQCSRKLRVKKARAY